MALTEADTKATHDEPASKRMRLSASLVERHLEETSRFAAQYAPQEKMRALVVDTFPALGKAAAF